LKYNFIQLLVYKMQYKLKGKLDIDHSPMLHLEVD